MQQPVGFYYHPTPNPSKIALFLEESGISYRLIPVDIAKGDRHSAEFRTLNPNGKVPVAARMVSQYLMALPSSYPSALAPCQEGRRLLAPTR